MPDEPGVNIRRTAPATRREIAWPTKVAAQGLASRHSQMVTISKSILTHREDSGWREGRESRGQVIRLLQRSSKVLCYDFDSKQLLTVYDFTEPVAST